MLINELVKTEAGVKSVTREMTPEEIAGMESCLRQPTDSERIAELEAALETLLSGRVA